MINVRRTLTRRCCHAALLQPVRRDADPRHPTAGTGKAVLCVVSYSRLKSMATFHIVHHKIARRALVDTLLRRKRIYASLHDDYFRNMHWYLKWCIIRGMRTRNLNNVAEGAERCIRFCWLLFAGPNGVDRTSAHRRGDLPSEVQNPHHISARDLLHDEIAWRIV